MKVFISYARATEGMARELVGHLESLIVDVWFDRELYGGQSWWKEILSRIRDCDVFLYCLSDASLRSHACAAELKYAQQLRKPVIPVQVAYMSDLEGTPVSDLQIVPYNGTSPENGAALLSSALKQYKNLHNKLPSPLPPEPPIPHEYLRRLRDMIYSDSISPPDQAALVGQLRLALKQEQDVSVRPPILKLVAALSTREDTTHYIADECRTLLEQFGSDAPSPSQPEPPPTPPPTPPPKPPSTARPRHRLLVAVVVLVVLVATGTATWWLTAAPEYEAQVQLEAVSSSSPSPFTAPTGTDQANVIAPANARGNLPGNTGGLYARDPAQPPCGAQDLISQLENDPARAAAWVQPAGTTLDELRAFVSSLTPVTLRADTALTEYGYRGGQFQPYPAVLEAGTAVLVNSFGEPTVKCSSGNPLGRPTSSNNTGNYVGISWNDFTPDRTITVAPTATPIKILVVVIPATNVQASTPVPPCSHRLAAAMRACEPNPMPPEDPNEELLLTGTHNDDSTVTLSDGRIQSPNGEIVPPRRTKVYPPGCAFLADGAIRDPGGRVFNRNGTERLPIIFGNRTINRDGSAMPPFDRDTVIWNYDGTFLVVRPGTHSPVQLVGQDGKIIKTTVPPPDGRVNRDGSISDAGGVTLNPDGTRRDPKTLPGGTVLGPDGATTPPAGSNNTIGALRLYQPGQEWLQSQPGQQGGADNSAGGAGGGAGGGVAGDGAGGGAAGGGTSNGGTSSGGTAGGGTSSGGTSRK